VRKQPTTRPPGAPYPVLSLKTKCRPLLRSTSLGGLRYFSLLCKENENGAMIVEGVRQTGPGTDQ
jgi:hypothetical protein